MRRKINVQLISISIISTMLVMLFVFYDLFQTQVQDDLSANAIVLKNTGIFHSGNEKAIHMDYRELRVTWISSDGTVLYDNDADVGTMDNHMSRPEVKNAFKRGDGSAVRQSATMGTNTFYYAIKLNDGSVLRVAREASNIWTVGGKIFPIIAATILVMMILCIILAHFMTKNLVKPIEQMAVDINDFSITPAYKELAPFAATIRAQHTDILKSARMRQDFTANVSHELKTPLTAISGYAELMENGMVPPEEIGSFAQKIEKNARRLLSLINDIIRLSELDSSNTQLLVEKFDLFEEAQICVENMQIYAEKKRKGQSGQLTRPPIYQCGRYRNRNFQRTPEASVRALLPSRQKPFQTDWGNRIGACYRKAYRCAARCTAKLRERNWQGNNDYCDLLN